MKHPGTRGITVAFLLAAVCTHVLAAGADDYWPTWRGLAAKGNPPVTWSESENVKWKVEIPGQGHSSPVIWGDRLLLQTAIDTGQARSAEAQANQPPAAAPGGRGGLSTPAPPSSATSCTCGATSFSTASRRNSRFVLAWGILECWANCSRTQHSIIPLFQSSLSTPVPGLWLIARRTE